MNKTRKILGVMLLLTGLILVSIPLYYEWQHGREVRALEEALSLISDYEQVEGTSFTTDELNAVLELEIPSIELKQKVLSETTEENLKLALTQLKENQHPGEGNFAIAGHRGYRGNRHFSRLPDVTIGDEVFLHTKEETFVYKVTDISIIEPTDVDILDDRDGKHEITMITCTRSGKQRVAVRGVLVG
ncbi:sortase [Halalkalibacterium halodurans]|uniref:BH0362 protein n=2 Tax=Halalkalibacterium halodurans TaxID=86665 RepID=Q9KFV9_HALH5|nr:sortase [Halalkalibacterium halodurans]MED4172824.1 sortase [Halalkalibacterium halodurans]BAB04081.1 BH0362 [Halalkalibacterium halodurans C-125]